MAQYCYYDETTGDYICEDDGSGSEGSFGWDLSDDTEGYGSLLDFGWKIDGSTWTDPQGSVFDLSYLDPGLAGEVKNFIKNIPKNAWNFFKTAFTNKDTGNIDWGKLVTLGGAILPLLQGSSNRPVGYQGGIPQYTAVRETVQGTYDPNRRPGSGGQRYFGDVQYVPKTGEGAAEALSSAQTSAAQQAQGLAALNATNPLNAAPPAYQPPAPPTTTTQSAPTYNDAYSGENVLKTVREMLNPPQNLARGGIVGLQDGGFVFPADVVSDLGNGSTDAGLAHLTRKGAVPIRGRGDGMSDSNRTTINGRQPAAVANGEAYLPPRQVQNMGGAEKLYAMMDKIRKDRHGTTKQGRQINPNQYV